MTPPKDPLDNDYIKQEIMDLNPDAEFIEGLDDALVGVIDCDGHFRAVYDHDLAVDIYKGMGLGDIEALESIEFNPMVLTQSPSAPMVIRNIRAEIKA